MKRLTYLVAHPEKPLDLSTIHDGRVSGMIVNGIRTRIEVATVRQGGLSSPVQPPRRQCEAMQNFARCSLTYGHDTAHKFPA